MELPLLSGCSCCCSCCSCLQMWNEAQLNTSTHRETERERVKEELNLTHTHTQKERPSTRAAGSQPNALHRTRTLPACCHCNGNCNRIRAEITLMTVTIARCCSCAYSWRLLIPCKLARELKSMTNSKFYCISQHSRLFKMFLFCSPNIASTKWNLKQCGKIAKNQR